MRRVRPTVLFLALITAFTAPAEAQLLKKVKNKAQKKAESVVEKQVDKGLDAAAGAVECVIDDRECIDKAESEGKPVVLRDATGAVVSTPDDVKPGEGVWANYDFVPGNRVLFAEDFDDDRVGNFPRRFEFVSGNAEVVEWQGRRLLRSISDTAFRVQLPESLPERFTIEFVFHQGAGHLAAHLATSSLGEKAWNQYPGSYLQLGNESGVKGKGPESTTNTTKTREALTAVRIQVDGSYMKVYLGEQRISNLPNAVVERGDALQIRLLGREGQPAYLGDLSVAAGGMEIYDTLLAEGRFVTHGILFDVNASRIRPESTPTLQDIAHMLKKHQELKLSIEGHTDSSGDDASNQSLSERRAAAVLDYLVASHGLDGSRLRAVGHGESKPVADNGTPEGRRNNRRVELVKLD